jgi:lysophospholipase L1-like esterase
VIRAATTTLAGLLLAGWFGVTASDAASADEAVPRASFTWSMEPRFGTDTNGDGRIEMDNTPEYAHNRVEGSCSDPCPTPGFNVTLEASPTASELGLPGSFLTYEWRLDGPAGSGTYYELESTLLLRLPEGHHTVDMRVAVRLPWGRVTQRARGDFEVNDLVVLALGDSYASGEGSTDLPIDGETSALWADSSDPDVEAFHALAHRSSVGWPVHVALALEDASPHTSVTFVNLTSSGARIDRGVVGERSQPPLPAQLDDATRIIQDRPIDLVLLQVGGNDVGFSRLIRALVDADPQLDPLCYSTMLDNTWASVADGAWDRGVTLTYDPPFRFGCEPTPPTRSSIPGLDGLVGAFDRLGTALSAFDVERVVLVEYPDPTGSPAPGELCQEIVGDVTPPFGFHEVDEQEQVAGVTRLLRPLNDTLSEVAAERGWIFIGGVAEAFASGHGYCSDWPDYGYPEWFRRSPFIFQQRLDAPAGWYRVPGRYGSALLLNDGPVSWYRTAAQSAVLQGPVPRYLTAGTLHPNEQGHLAISRLVLSALAGD